MMRGREATEYSTCSPTVPSGDTPCLTAGDARRVNPWRCGEGEKRETSQPAPTVPGGDTLCVTAGDARRVNPWRELHTSLRHRRCRTASTLVTLSTFAARRRRRRKLVGLLIPRVHPRSARASPAVKHGAPPPEA